MVKFDPVSSSREVMSTSNVHEIQKTKATPKTKNVPMVDGKKRRSDAEIKAQAKLKEDIKNNNILYNETGLFGALGTLFDKGRIDNEIIFSKFPEGTTLGDIRKRYNLPKTERISDVYHHHNPAVAAGILRDLAAICFKK